MSIAPILFQYAVAHAWLARSPVPEDASAKLSFKNSVILSEGELEWRLTGGCRRAGVEGPSHFYPSMIKDGQDTVARGRFAAFLGRERNLDAPRTCFAARVLRLGSAHLEGKSKPAARLAQDDGVFCAVALLQESRAGRCNQTTGI